MSEVDLGDPIKGLAWVERHIGETEMLMKLEKAKDEPDAKVLSRLEYTLLKWGELAEKYGHQKFQQGKSQTDIATASKRGKMRVNG